VSSEPFSTPPPSADVPPGWYQDPDRACQRYWDGSRWTERTAPLLAANREPVPVAETFGWFREGRDELPVAEQLTALAFAFLLPIVGFILAIVWLTRGKLGDGAALMLLSVLGSVIWYAVLTGVV
jgi:hypothetical protein